MRINFQDYKWLIGKIAKLTEFGVVLEGEYKKLFNFGNPNTAQLIYEYCNAGNQFELRLMFIDEKPIFINGLTFYCLKDIGKYSMGDYHWHTLEQLIVCDKK